MRRKCLPRLGKPGFLSRKTIILQESSDALTLLYGVRAFIMIIDRFSGIIYLSGRPGGTMVLRSEIGKGTEITRFIPDAAFDSGNEDLINVAKAICLYNRAAVAFFDAEG